MNPTPETRTEEQEQIDYEIMFHACMKKAREVMPRFAENLEYCLSTYGDFSPEENIFDPLWNLGDMIFSEDHRLEYGCFFNTKSDEPIPKAELPNPHHFKEVVQAVIDVMREDQQFYTPKATDFTFVAQNIFTCYTPTEVAQ